jgi:hypothetical protein
MTYFAKKMLKKRCYEKMLVGFMFFNRDDWTKTEKKSWYFKLEDRILCKRLQQNFQWFQVSCHTDVYASNGTTLLSRETNHGSLW